MPRLRRTDHASGLRRKLIGQRADAGFEPVRSQCGFGRFAGQVGELLVRDREGHVISDAAGHPQLPLVEGVRSLRPERKGQHLIASGHVNRQGRTVTGRTNAIPEIARHDWWTRIRFFEVADNRAPACVRDQVINLQPRGQRGPFTRRRLHGDLPSAEKCERQKIVREDGRGDLRDLRKDPPDVEDRGQCAQQFVRCLEVPQSLPLDVERRLQRAVVQRVIDRERHLIRDERQKRHVLRVVEVEF